MNLIFHHLRKDIHAQLWLLVLWALVLLALVLPDLFILHTSYVAARTIDTIAMSPLPMFVGSLGWVILLVRLVQSEPVIGSTSFWLTRPVPKSVFLGSKAIFLLTLVLLPAFTPLLVHYILFKPGPELARTEIISLLEVQLIAATCVIWLATYSSNLLKFAGLLCLSFLLFYLLMMIAFTLLRPRLTGLGGVPFQLQLTGLSVLVPGFAISLVLQHWRRLSNLGLGVGIVAIVLAAIVQMVWPFSIPPSGSTMPYPVSNPTTVNFSPDWSTHVTWSPRLEPSTRTWESVASAQLKPDFVGEDSEIFVQTITATFQPPGGPDIALIQPFNFYGSPFPVMRGNYSQVLMARLRTLSLNGVPPSVPGPPQELFRLDSKLSGALRGQTGTLTLKAKGQVDTLEEVAVIPLGQPDYIARRDGGFIRVAPIPPGSTEMLLWEVGPRKGANWSASSSSICVLVDPTTGTSQELSSGGNSSSSGGFGFTGYTMVDTETNWRLTGNEPINRMVLHVFRYRATSDFTSTLTAPNFTMTPVLK
jgi:hypothetical protein